MRAELDRRGWLFTIIHTQADRELRDEINASIDGSPPLMRPDLRRLVRQINERLASSPTTAKTEASAQPAP